MSEPLKGYECPQCGGKHIFYIGKEGEKDFVQCNRCQSTFWWKWKEE